MDIRAIKTLFYSPTGTSRKIAEAISKGVQDQEPITQLDLTPPSPYEKSVLGAEELAVIAVPVYAGRIAPVARERLQTISGSSTPAIVVVVYGNREYEDALLELVEFTQGQSFTVVGAAAFIGEHSFSSVEQPVAHGRPDESDLNLAQKFGSELRDKLTDSITGEVEVPGNSPYRDGMPNLPFTPTIITAGCTLCKQCFELCPTGAIDGTDSIGIDPGKCTFCCSCIKGCPEQCISLGKGPMAEKALWLHENCSSRKEPELFF